MYSQILYFIVALLLFSIQQPGTQTLFPLLDTILLGLGLSLAYVVSCRLVFRPIRRALSFGLPISAITPRYHRAQARLSILALLVLAAYVYVLNIKFYLRQLPGFDESLALSGLVGLAIYLAHLSVIWILSYPIHKRVYDSRISRAQFIRGHMAFAAAILIPWLLISLVLDLVELVSLPPFLRTAEGQFILLGAALVLFVLFAPWLVVRLWGCQPLPQGPERRNIEQFCAEHRFRVGELMYWPLFGGEILTAGVVGILPGLRYIMITKGLLAILDMEEVRAVIAHEMGHVRRFHVFFYLIFFVGFTIFAYYANALILLALLRSETLMEWSFATDTLHLTLFSIVLSAPVLIMLVFYFRYFFGFFLRNSERQADLFALRLIGHPFTLVSSLEKIGLFSGHIRDLPSWHHFSIRQRVELLLAAHADPWVAKRHDRKLYATVLVLVLAVATTVFATPGLVNTGVVKQWLTEHEIHRLEHQLSRNPRDAGLYAYHGGLLMELGRYDKAESSLKKAYELTPKDATVLNNLAWLYATAPPPHRDPQASLDLAKQAAAIDPEPHVLDTLAEAYYANGLYEEAIESIKSALAQQPQNREYYLGQMKKFEETLKSSGTGGDSR